MNRLSGRILLIVAAFALFLVPVAAIAAAGFTDVADDNVFVADIQWMKDTGVTKGCNPPTNDKFCPSANVTREQMSAFMHRLAVNKVVDAATAVEADNADKLDGKDSTAFLGKTEKAADSDELDGRDSLELFGIQSTGGDDSTLIDGTSLATDFTDLGTMTVTAPADGAFMITWSGWIRCSAVDEDEIRLYVNDGATTLFNVEECVSDKSDRSLSSHHVLAAADGVSYKLEMRGHDWNGLPRITMHDARLTALFVPYGIGIETPVTLDAKGTTSDGGSGS